MAVCEFEPYHIIFNIVVVFYLRVVIMR